MVKRRIMKDDAGTVILSSIGLNSKCSTIEANAPAITPASPNVAPIEIENKAIARLPHQDLVLLL